jgi:hypothetical protein
MRVIVRIVVGLVGVFNLVLGLGFFTQTVAFGAKFFISADNIQGLATMRADFTSFFVTAGALAIVGAWRQSGRCLLVPMMLFGVALSGRIVSVAVDGALPTAYSPMIIEAVMVGILAVGFWVFQRERRRVRVGQVG